MNKKKKGQNKHFNNYLSTNYTANTKLKNNP